eukprot:scaffold10266_cov294-Chaetoceros_neogracile.AAC.17
MMQPMQQIAGRTQDATQQLIVPGTGRSAGCWSLELSGVWSLESDEKVYNRTITYVQEIRNMITAKSQ